MTRIKINYCHITKDLEMKKVSILILLCGLVSSVNLFSEVAQDTYAPTIFYNTDNFSDGIFDASGNPTFSGRTFGHASIAWDLNNVVFNTTANTPKTLWKLYQEYGLYKTMAFYQEVMKVISQKSKYKKAGDPRGFVWNALFYDIKNEEFRKILFETTIEANTLHKPIVELLKELTLNLHQNIVLSNMGQDVLNLQIKRLQEQLKQQSSDDLSAKRVDTFFILEFLNNPLNTVASKENGWLHKPDKESYEICLAKIKENASTQKNLTIFIDNKKENVVAAAQKGLFDIAFLYTNADELQTLFYNLNLIGNAPTIRNFKEVQNLFSPKNESI